MNFRVADIQACYELWKSRGAEFITEPIPKYGETRYLLYDQQDQPIGLRARGGHQQRIIAVDYGTTNPMVFLDSYDDGRLFWVTREYYWDSAVEMRQKTDAEYTDDLAQFIGPDREAKVIIDPSAASFKAEMLKRGIWHANADDDVNEGIRITSMLLNQRLLRFCRQTTPGQFNRYKSMPSRR